MSELSEATYTRTVADRESQLHLERIEQLSQVTSLTVLADAIESSLASALEYNGQNGSYRRVDVESVLESTLVKFRVFRQRVLDKSSE